MWLPNYLQGVDISKKAMICCCLITFNVRQFAYVAYASTPTFIGECMILDMRSLIRTHIFSL